MIIKKKCVRGVSNCSLPLGERPQLSKVDKIDLCLELLNEEPTIQNYTKLSSS